MTLSYNGLDPSLTLWRRTILVHERNVVLSNRQLITNSILLLRLTPFYFFILSKHYTQWSILAALEINTQQLNRCTWISQWYGNPISYIPNIVQWRLGPYITQTVWTLFAFIFNFLAVKYFFLVEGKLCLKWWLGIKIHPVKLNVALSKWLLNTSIRTSLRQEYPATKNADMGIPRRHSPWIYVDIGHKTDL